MVAAAGQGMEHGVHGDDLGGLRLRSRYSKGVLISRPKWVPIPVCSLFEVSDTT